MKKRMQFLAILLASTFVLGGCGTSMYELTDDEEDLIVSAAANAVAKHNVFQMDGMTDAEPETETQTVDETTEQNTSRHRKKQIQIPVAVERSRKYKRRRLHFPICLVRI